MLPVLVSGYAWETPSVTKGEPGGLRHYDIPVSAPGCEVFGNRDGVFAILMSREIRMTAQNDG